MINWRRPSPRGGRHFLVGAQLQGGSGEKLWPFICPCSFTLTAEWIHPLAATATAIFWFPRTQPLLLSNVNWRPVASSTWDCWGIQPLGLSSFSTAHCARAKHDSCKLTKQIPNYPIYMCVHIYRHLCMIYSINSDPQKILIFKA